MRAFSNWLPAALVVAALFWGNCFSCPRILLSLAKQDANGCCKRSAPVPQKCATGVLKQFEKADPVSVAAPAVMPAPQAEYVPAPTPADTALVAIAQSPPEQLEPASVLRI